MLAVRRDTTWSQTGHRKRPRQMLQANNAAHRGLFALLASTCVGAWPARLGSRFVGNRHSIACSNVETIRQFQVSLTSAEKPGRSIDKLQPAERLSFASATSALQSDKCNSLPQAGCHWFVGIDPDLKGSIVAIRSYVEPLGEHRAASSSSTIRAGATLEEAWEAAGVYPHCSGWDMPVAEHYLVNGKRKRRLCGQHLHSIWQMLLQTPSVMPAFPDRVHVVIERPSTLPCVDGWQSAFVCGLSFGVVLGVLSALGIKPIEVLPSQWKAQMGLRGLGKDDSRALAIKLFPSMASALRRKKDHGRAEGLLIAAWAAMYLDAHVEKQEAIQNAASFRHQDLANRKQSLSSIAAQQHVMLTASGPAETEILSGPS